MHSPISRRTVTMSLLAGAAALGTPGAALAAPSPTEDEQSHRHGHERPTIVLIHGAFADASSWSAVVERLQRQGHHAVVPALPLRGLAGDAAYIRSVLDGVPGPIVLVGHFYGGAVISVAAADAPRVKALVYSRAHTIRVRAPHAVAVSDPGPVTELILRATRSAH